MPLELGDERQLTQHTYRRVGTSSTPGSTSMHAHLQEDVLARLVLPVWWLHHLHVHHITWQCDSLDHLDCLALAPALTVCALNGVQHNGSKRKLSSMLSIRLLSTTACHAASYLPEVRVPVMLSMEQQHNEEHSKQVMREEEDGMAVQHALDRTASCSRTAESVTHVVVHTQHTTYHEWH